MRKQSAQSLAYGRGPPGVGAAFIPKTLGALGLGVGPELLQSKVRPVPHQGTVARAGLSAARSTLLPSGWRKVLPCSPAMGGAEDDPADTQRQNCTFVREAKEPDRRGNLNARTVSQIVWRP